MKNLIFLAPLILFSCADNIQESSTSEKNLSLNIQNHMIHEFTNGNVELWSIKEKSCFDSNMSTSNESSTLVKVNKIEEILIDQIRLMDQVKLEILVASGLDNSDLIKVCGSNLQEKKSTEPITIKIESISDEVLGSRVNKSLGITNSFIIQDGRANELFAKSNLLAKDLAEIIESGQQTDNNFEFETIDNYIDEVDLADHITNMLIENPLSKNTDLIRSIYCTLSKSKGMKNLKGSNVWIEENFKDASVLSALNQITLMQDDILRLRTKIYQEFNKVGPSFNFDSINIQAIGPDEIGKGETSEVVIQVVAMANKVNLIEFHNTNVPVKKNNDGTASILIKDQTGKDIKLKGEVTVYTSQGIPKTLPWSKTIKVESK